MSEEFTGYRRGSAGYRRVIAALACAGIVTFAQLYSPQGVLPLIADDLHISPADAGLLISAATIGLACSVIPWSYAADRFGRKQAMSVAIVLATTLGIAVTFAQGQPWLLGLRFLEGAALGGIPALAVAYLNEEIDRKDAPLAAGTYVAGTTVGGLLGRVIAGPVGDLFGWRTGMLSVSLLALVAAIGFILLAPKPRGFVVVRAHRRGKGTTTAVGAAEPPTNPPGSTALLFAHLRNPRMLVLFAQGLFLMGGFVAIYNYLGFRLEAPPFLLSHSLIALIFVAYLAGTVSSPLAGRLTIKYGRRTVLLVSIGIMIAGVLMTTAGALPVILAGLVVLTAGFFGAHSIASGWAGAEASAGRAQATSLYNLAYYVGSSLFGWLGGVAFGWWGWPGTAGIVLILAVIAAALVATVLPRRATAA